MLQLSPNRAVLHSVPTPMVASSTTIETRPTAKAPGSRSTVGSGHAETSSSSWSFIPSSATPTQIAATSTTSAT